MPEEKKSEMDMFLGDLQKDDNRDAFVQPEPEKVVEEEVKVTPRDNREARRAKEALQREREANIALNAKLQTLSEVQRFSQDTKSPIEDEVSLIFTSDEVGQLGAKRLTNILEKIKQDARDSALEAFESRQEQLQEEVRNQESVLDGFLEQVEDEFDVDLTSNAPAARKARQGFFSKLERVSPKDEEGMVKDYADPIAVWEALQDEEAKKRPDSNRAKDLGSRSMVRSGASADTKLEDNATARFLKEAGII